jgi:hypothetical protein
MRITASRGGAQPSALVGRVNRREVSAAPPKVAPAGAITVQVAASRILTGGMQLTGGLSGTLAALRPLEESVKLAAEMVNFETQSGSTVGGLPGVANFVIMRPGEIFNPVAGVDSVEATRFKAALSQTFETMQQSARAGTPPPRTAIDLDAVASEAATALDPAMTITRRVKALIEVPPQVGEEVGDGFVEPMAYPEIDSPMFEPLAKLSPELFLPNINLISPNSVTLVEANRPFIEAYMVGLNHEFARELLWREYPTDQRGSTFRQFWDVRGSFDMNPDSAGTREKLRDIQPLHRWKPDTMLGSHDNRSGTVSSKNQLVLVVRGELLKRYPTAVIYAHRACWQRKDNGTPADRAKHPCGRSGAIDNTKERRLAPLTEAEEIAPPPTKVLTPMFEAKVDPDIYFLGFDLTAAQARGESGDEPDDDPGWFFVIKERPGEPRFGLDAEGQPQLNVWNDLSWKEVQPAAPGAFIQIASAPAAFPLVTPGPADDEKSGQHADDRQVAWSRGMSSAELAYILFQTPVLVAVHASEMLPK